MREVRWTCDGCATITYGDPKISPVGWTQARIILAGCDTLNVDRLIDLCKSCQQRLHDAIQIDKWEKTPREVESLNIPEERYKQMLLSPISVLGLPTRPEYALGRNGIETISDLIKITPAEFLRFDNVGKKSLQDVERALELMGLKLS